MGMLIDSLDFNQSRFVILLLAERLTMCSVPGYKRSRKGVLADARDIRMSLLYAVRYGGGRLLNNDMTGSIIYEM